LKPVPQLDLSGAEQGARRQLEDQLQKLEGLLPEAKEKAGETAEAFGDLGLLYLTYDFLAPARVCFANAGRLQPLDLRWPYLEGYLLQTQGQIAEAVESFDQALTLEPSSLEALLRSGRGQLALGRLEDAERRFRKARELNPSVAAAHEGLGKVAEASGDLKLAAEHFEHALELEPRATALHYSLSQAYRGLGDLAKAESHESRRGDVSTRVPDPLISALATRAASSQFYLVQGAEAFEDQSYREAAASYRQALEVEPESIAALRGLSASLAAQGDFPGAAEALQRALGLAGTGEETRQERAGLLRSFGDLLFRGGRPLPAAAVYRQSLELVPEQPGVALLEADALARGGRLEEALKSYEELLKAGNDRGKARILVKKATALVNLGQKEPAEAAFREAVALEPENPRIRLRFSEALDFLGDLAGGARQRTAAEQRVPEGPEGGPVWLELARSAQSQGNSEIAEKEYRRALERNPKILDAQVGLANLLTTASRWEEAVVELRDALEKDPRYRPAHLALVRALILSGRFGEARVQLQNSLKTLPQDEDLALDQVRLLASCPDPDVRDGNLALEIALRVHAVSPGAAARAALALAHGAAGQWDDAMAVQGRLLEEAREQKSSVYAALFAARLASFEKQQPWIAASGEEILDLVR